MTWGSQNATEEEAHAQVRPYRAASMPAVVILIDTCILQTAMHSLRSAEVVPWQIDKFLELGGNFIDTVRIRIEYRMLNLHDTQYT